MEIKYKTLSQIKEKNNITISAEEQKTAEEKFGMTEEQLQTKLDNSSDGKRKQYQEAGYTASSLFSFLITKDKLKSA